MTISDLLQNANVPIVVLVCGGMCLLSFILLIILPIVTNTLQVFSIITDLVTTIITSLTGVLTAILSAGPIAWCGCLFFLSVFAMCGGLALIIANVLATCGTPNQVLFCRLF